MQAPTQRGRRSATRHLLGCAMSAGALFTGLHPGLARAQLPANRQQDAWAAAQQAIQNARHMAERITSSLDGLTQQTARALAARERLRQELRKLADEIARLTSERDRLLEEYRSGLFCSGCGKTKSQILAQGDTFPHPGQSIVRPTPEQIARKERELQAPIDRAQRQSEASEKDLKENSATADAGIDQIRAGVALWRTAVTYWSGSVHRGLRERHQELQQAVAEFQAALQAELRRQSAAAPADPQASQAEAAVWRRLLEQQQAEIAAFQADSRKTSLQLSQQRRDQQGTIATHIRRDPLGTSLLAVAVVDAPISPGESPYILGERYLLGRIPKPPAPNAPTPPPEVLANVSAFIAEFKASRLVVPASTPPDMPLAQPGPPPAAPRTAPPLLQALP